jgi:hypothetical protein
MEGLNDPPLPQQQPAPVIPNSGFLATLLLLHHSAPTLKLAPGRSISIVHRKIIHFRIINLIIRCYTNIHGIHSGGVSANRHEQKKLQQVPNLKMRLHT